MTRWKKVLGWNRRGVVGAWGRGHGIGRPGGHMSIPMVLRNAGNRDGQRNMSQGCVVLKRTRAFSSDQCPQFNCSNPRAQTVWLTWSVLFHPCSNFTKVCAQTPNEGCDHFSIAYEIWSWIPITNAVRVFWFQNQLKWWIAVKGTTSTFNLSPEWLGICPFLVCVTFHINWEYKPGLIQR